MRIRWENRGIAGRGSGQIAHGTAGPRLPLASFGAARPHVQQRPSMRDAKIRRLVGLPVLVAFPNSTRRLLLSMRERQEADLAAKLAC